jgi:hypothetical protein
VPDPTSERIQTLEPFPEEHPLAPRRTGSTSDLVHPLTDLPPELVYAATFGADGDAAPDDAWMAIPDDGGVRVYTKGEHYATLRHPSGPMSLLAIGPNGRVLTESFDGVSRDWHLDDATLLALARPRTVLGFSAEQVHTLRLGPLLERRARPWAR